MDTKEIIFDLMDDYTKGVDTYSHNGSTWLIFTDSKKWVIELTKEKTLWYNYYFFTGVFKYLSLDVVENQHYITKWVEDTIINPVKHTSQVPSACLAKVKDTIKNGVKSTKGEYYKEIQKVEYTIQNGVKDTRKQEVTSIQIIEDTIKNGVKETISTKHPFGGRVEDTIQNGVKNTYSDKIPHDYDWSDQFTEEIDDIIENGVKETKEEPSQRTWMSQQVIENGVKGTKAGGYLGFVEMKGKKIHQFETAKQLYYVEDVIDSGIKKTEGGVLFDESKIDTVIIEGVKETKCAKDKDIYDPHTFQNQKFERERRINEVIQDGIKEVQPLPSQEGNKDWGDYYHRQKDRTKPHTQYVDDVILNGIKETVTGSDKRMLVENVLNNGIKLT